MKRIYTFGHEQVERNITVGDILENKKNNKIMTQVTAANQVEAEIIANQGINFLNLLHFMNQILHYHI